MASHQRVNSKLKAFSLKKGVALVLEQESKKENRSVSNYVDTVLMNHFKEKGLEIPESV